MQLLPGILSRKSRDLCVHQVLRSSESSFNCLERHRQVELNVHLACHWRILWYSQKMGIWGNDGKTLVRGVSSVYVYMHSHTTIICELNSHQKTVSNLWHGAVGIRKPALFINSYGFIHPSPPLFVLMWKGPVDQKRPRHSRQILATPARTIRTNLGLRSLKNF